MRDLIHWTEMSYTHAGQRAWACRSGSGDVLFYLVGHETEWGVRNSLGKGYRAGSWAPTHGVKFRARDPEQAMRLAVVRLADALASKADELRKRAAYLKGAACQSSRDTPQEADHA